MKGWLAGDLRCVQHFDGWEVAVRALTRGRARALVADHYGLDFIDVPAVVRWPVLDGDHAECVMEREYDDC